MNAQLPHIDFQPTLKGQTLIEVLTSLSILSAVFVMGLMLFQQFTGVQAPVEKQQTRLMMENWLAEPVGLAPEVAERDIRGRRLVRKIHLLDPDRRIFRVEVSAYWGQRLLGRRWKVVQEWEEGG